MLVIGELHGVTATLGQRGGGILIGAGQLKGELVVLLPSAAAQGLGHLKEAGTVKAHVVGRVLVDEGSLVRLVCLDGSGESYLLGLKALGGVRLVHLVGIALGQTVDHNALSVFEVKDHAVEGIAGDVAGRRVLLAGRQSIALGVLERDFEGERGVGRLNTARARHGLADLEGAGLYVVGGLGGLELTHVIADAHGRGVGDGLVHSARQHAHLHGNGTGIAGSHVGKRPGNRAIAARAAVARLDELDAHRQRVGEGDGRGVISIVGIADGIGDLVAHLDLGTLIGARRLSENAARGLIGLVGRAVRDGNLRLVLDLCSGNRGIALNADGHAHAAVRASGAVGQSPGHNPCVAVVGTAVGCGDELHAVGQRIGDGHGRGNALAVVVLTGYGVVHPVDVVGVVAAGREDLAVEVLARAHGRHGLDLVVHVIELNGAGGVAGAVLNLRGELALAVVGHDEAHGAAGVAGDGAHAGGHARGVLDHAERQLVGGGAVVLQDLLRVVVLNGLEQVELLLPHALAEVELELRQGDLCGLPILGCDVGALGDLQHGGAVGLDGIDVEVELVGLKVAAGEGHVGPQGIVVPKRPGAGGLVGVLEGDDDGVHGAVVAVILLRLALRHARGVVLGGNDLELELARTLGGLVRGDGDQIVAGVIGGRGNIARNLGDLEVEGLAAVGVGEREALEQAGDGLAIGVQALVGHRDGAVLCALEHVDLGLGGVIGALGLEGELAGTQGAAVQDLLDVKAAFLAERRGGAVGVGEAVAALRAGAGGLGRQLAAGVAHGDGEHVGVLVVVPTGGVVGDVLGNVELIGTHLVKDELVKTDDL